MKSRIISAFLAAVMIFGIVPAMPVFADDEPILLNTQKLENVEYDENISYAMMGTVQSEVDERGRYIITVYRCGNTSAESSVDLKTADVSAKYGIDYIIDDDRYTTKTSKTDATLLELSADEENVREGEEKLDNLQAMVDSMADTEENSDTPKATEDMFYISNDEEGADDSDLSDETAVKDEEKSSLAKRKEKQTGLKTRPTYETDMEPVTNVIMNSMGVVDIAEHIETSSTTPIVFNPGETEKQIIIKILEDDESEGQEIINFMLSDPDENTVLAEPITTSVIINDDEPVVHSKISFDSDKIYTHDGVAEISVTRDEALYSYVTAKVRTVENGDAIEGKNYSLTDMEIEFRPYQEEVSFEIPVSADEDMSFGIELYDLKGGENGDYMSAQVNIGAEKGNDANISLLSSSSSIIEINGNEYTLEREGNVAKIMDYGKVNPIHVGNYYYPTPDNVEYGFSRGRTWRRQNGYNEGGGYGCLECYESHVDYHGEEYAKFPFSAKKYQSAWLDFSSHSNWENSQHGFRVVPNYSIMPGTLAEIKSRINKGDYHCTEAQGRAVRGPIILLTDEGRPPILWNSNTMEIYAKRAGNGWIAPETHFYGIALMFREFHIEIEQPDVMEFKTPNGTVKKRPATVRPGTGQEIIYADQTLTINATATENGGVIKGILKGYEISTGDEVPFFYKTNSTSIKFDNELIERIDRYTKKAKEVSKKGYYTNVFIKPVYDYIPVKMEILPSADGEFKDSDLKQSSENVLHVGDTLDVEHAEPAFEGYNYDTYLLESYRNPGDTKPVMSGTMLPGSNDGKLELRERRYRLRPNFTDRINYIEIQLDEEAEKYFDVLKTVPESYISDPYLKGKKLLYVSEKPYVVPTAAKAYTIELTEKEECNGKYRPKITREYTGEYVNGWAMDIIAEPMHGHNTIKVTAEKVPEDEKHNVALDCLVRYSSVSVRQSSEELLNEPAIGAFVTAGTSLGELYDRDGNLVHRVNRTSGTADENGMSEILLKDIYDGDRISVSVTNNDIDQVYYTTVNTGKLAGKKEKKFSYLKAVDGKNKEVTETLTFEAGQDAPETVEMPIRTPYAPYVIDVRYASDKHPEMDTRNNGVERYEDDALTFTAEINANGHSIKRVDFLRYNKNGEMKQKYEADKDGDGTYSVTAESSEISDGDKLYVRIVANAEVFIQDEGKIKNIEKEYPILNTGLNFYTPVVDIRPQHMQASGDVLGSLPLIGDIATDLDTGNLRWKTYYADEKNKSTSAKAEVVSLAISLEEVKKASEKLNKFKNGKSKEAKSAQETVDEQLAKFDPQRDASAQDLQQLAQACAAGKTDEEKQAIADKWTEKQKAQKRKELQSQQKKDSVAKMNKKNAEWDIQFTVLLQFEYVYDHDLNTHKFVGGQYLFGGAFSIEKTWYALIYGVPVYLNTSANVSLQLDGVYTVPDGTRILAKELQKEENLLDSRFKSSNPWGQLGLGGKLQPGVGICGILGVRGVFSLNAILRQLFSSDGISSQSSGAMITMSGGVGIDLLLFSFDYEIGSLKYAWGVYDQNDSISLLSSNDEGNISIRTLDRGNETDTLLGDDGIRLRSSLEPVEKTDLITGAMEYVRPKIINLGDGRLMMIYLKNDKTRDDANAASLAYTIKDNGAWSEPIYVESDGTADGPADIMRDGNKVYIAWSSTDTPAEANGNDIEAVKRDLQKMNIRMCIYDITSGTLSEVVTVTNDMCLNSDVRLAKEGGNIALYYLKKDIEDADSAEKLISITSNYNTWAKKLFDPDTEEFVKIADDDEEDGYEKLIYIKHPKIDDPLVCDYSVEKYTFDNGTKDDTSDDLQYSIAAYSVDNDRNINTNNDRQVWLEITDIKENKTYYPIKVSKDGGSITNLKLTEVNGDVLLTWLSDTSVFNTISIKSFFETMKNQTGDVDGKYTGTTALDLMRSLTPEEAKQQNWGEILQDKAKETMSSAALEKFDELFSSIDDIVTGSFATNPKDFSDGDEQMNMSDYQIVVGEDENTYLFWTGPSAEITNYGKELYGTAYYRVSDEWKETWDSDMPDSGWGDPVRLTEYGEVIEEMTIAVDDEKNAVIIANMFEQTIDENGEVKHGEHKLSEINCIPSNSLEIVDDEIKLSNEYPVAGETTTISFNVKNTGLLPSTGQDIRIKIVKDGEVITDKSLNETGDKNVIFVGNEFEYSIEWTPDSIDGDIEIIAEVGEHGTRKVNTASKKLEKKADIEFEQSYTWDTDKIFAELNQYPEDTPKDEMSAQAAIVHDILYSANAEPLNYIVFVPVYNNGNEAMQNITANAVHIDKEFNKGDILGGSKAIKLEPKESGLLAIPVKGEEKHYTKDGIMELMLTVNSGETRLDWDNLHETIYENGNMGVIANDGIGAKEMKKNETFAITARAYPFDNMKKMTYFSLDSDVAQVSEDGVVTATGAGKTTVCALDMVSGISDEIEITVDGANKSSGGGGATVCNVAFETNGGSKISDVGVNKNAVLSKPGDPTKDGYTFGGWYSDKECTAVYDFAAKVTKSMTLYAKWIEKEKEPDTPHRENPFDDVKESDWFYDAVTEAASKGIVNGISDTVYEPNGTLTRAMFTTMLHRYAGEPVVDYAMPYTDIEDGAWYTEAVRWASAEGIVNGLDDKTFAPNSPITREQMAAMIYRYVQLKGKGFTGEWMFRLDYTDSADVSQYAYEAMCWNTMNGIISGMGDDTLSPKTTATRAQVAAVIVRLVKALAEN